MCDYKLVGKDEVKEMMGCSDQMAYKVIRQLNKELAAQGVRTVSGKVSRTYLIERYCLPMLCVWQRFSRHFGCPVPTIWQKNRRCLRFLPSRASRPCPSSCSCR